MTLGEARERWDMISRKLNHNEIAVGDWLIAEAERLEKVREWKRQAEAEDGFRTGPGWEELRIFLSDGKPKCTCEDGSGIICGHHWREALDAFDRDKQPESPQNVTAPADWFSGYLELKGLFMALERSKDDWGSALEKRIEALDRGLKEHAKVALEDLQDIRYSLTDLRYRVEALEKRR